MAFPTQYLFTVLEVSVRWGCTQAQVVDWAIAGELELLYGFSPVRLGDAAAVGLMAVAGNEVRPLFRQHSEPARKAYLTQARLPETTGWQTITQPSHGVRVTASDIVISADEIDRFEVAHGVNMAAELGVEAHRMELVLDRVLRAHLAEMAEVMVRKLNEQMSDGGASGVSF